MVGGYGFTGRGAQAARAPVELRVLQGDTELFATKAIPGAGWQEFDALLADNGPLKIVNHTRDNGVSHFCIDLVVAGASP